METQRRNGRETTRKLTARIQQFRDFVKEEKGREPRYPFNSISELDADIKRIVTKASKKNRMRFLTHPCDYVRTLAAELVEKEKKGTK